MPLADSRTCWFCKGTFPIEALIAGYDTFEEQRLACLACNERMSGNWRPASVLDLDDPATVERLAAALHNTPVPDEIEDGDHWPDSEWCIDIEHEWALSILAALRDRL